MMGTHTTNLAQAVRARLRRRGHRKFALSFTAADFGDLARNLTLTLLRANKKDGKWISIALIVVVMSFVHGAAMEDAN